MEKLRFTKETKTVELKFLHTIENLDLLGEKVTENKAYFHMAHLEIDIELDLSGEEWDDDYDPKNG